MNRPLMHHSRRRAAAPDVFGEAVACQQAGRHAAAAELYRRLLAASAGNAAAWSNLGVAQLSLGQAEQAVASLRRAVALRPDYAQALLNLGDALRAVRSLPESLAAYSDAAARVPPSAMLQNNIGVVLAQLGRADEAIAAFRGAAALDAEYADAHANLARTLLKAHEHDAGAQLEAIGALQRALALVPGSVELLSDLGMALTLAGDWQAGAATCRAAIAARPGHIPAHLHLANALQRGREYEAAMQVCRAALQLAPANADLLNGLAAAATMAGALQYAALAARQALAQRPDYVAAWFNLGYACERMGDLEGAIAAQRRALAIDPGFAAGELKLAHALLAQGRYAAAWPHFEARWRTAEIVSRIHHAIDRPRWAGEALHGRTILLHWEQGLGDTLQLLRFVPEVVRRGGRVLLMVQPGLESIVPAWDGVTLLGDAEDTPPFDVHCPLFSLPLVLGLHWPEIPAPVPYVGADAGLAAAWRQRLAGALPAVGLVWAGNAANKGDLPRSIPLPSLAPLLDVAGVRLFSVQRDLRPGDAEWLAGPGAGIVQIGPELGDFGVTAAVLSALDLLVTVDTSVCHLAGALGRPAWLMVPFSPEWRWAPDGDRSAWYPSVRLLRQAAPGDWAPVIARVAAHLAGLADAAKPA